MVTPILPIAGVPDQLIQTLNIRFRQIAPSTSTTKQTVINSSSGGGGGGGGGGAADGYYVVVLNAMTHHATPLLGSGLNQEVDLGIALTYIDGPSGGSAGSWTLFLYQDTTGGRLVSFNTLTYLGAAALNDMVSLVPNTYTAITFVSRPDGKQAMKHIATGLVVTRQIIILTATASSSPTTIVSTLHGLSTGQTVVISGATLTWLSLNASWVVTVVDANTFTILLDSTGFGTITGVVYGTINS